MGQGNEKPQTPNQEVIKTKHESKCDFVKKLTKTFLKKCLTTIPKCVIIIIVNEREVK